MSVAPLQFLLLVFAGRVNRRQLEIVEYLQEENRVLREQLGDRRLRFTDAQRRRLRQLAKHWGNGRDLVWISLDPMVPMGVQGRHSVQALDVPENLVAEYQRDGVFALLGLMSFEDGLASGTLLARAHPSGTRMRWLDQASAAMLGDH